MNSFKSLTDNELLLLYKQGNVAAFEALVLRHKDRLYTSIIFMVKDEWLAEDIFQDTFYKVIDSLRVGKYNEEGKFLPWVMMIANNLCMDYFRRNKRMPIIVDSDGKDILNILRFAEESKEDKIMREQTILQIKEMIELLPTDQKEVLVLRHYADLSFKEIADQTGVSINTALGRMRYALNNLRKMMEQQSVKI